jgi:DNA-binding SARP family transcriptional activator
MFLLSPGQPMPVERILEDLWGEEVPSGGSKTVGFHISKLRDALEPDRERGQDGSFIRTTPAGYLLDIAPETIDVRRFESLLEEARAVIGVDPGAAAALSRDALGLWRGPALADFAYEEFAQDEIRRLDELRLHAVETRVDADLALGRHADLIAELNGLVSDHPLRESLRATLMVALYRSGRQADALRVFDDTRRTLGEELGIEPSTALRDLEARILAQDPDLDLPVRARPSSAAPRSEDIPNPYIGLRPFSEAEAEDFHGREDLTARAVERLMEARFVALVGPSGSGKSSIARAGVLPIVRETHVVARMVPGDRPLEELEIAMLRAFPEAPASASGILRSDEGGLRRMVQLLEAERPVLLVVDQFEELWSLAGEGARAEFIDRLLDALDDDRANIKVLVTLRSDFLGEPLSSPQLAGWIDDGMILVSPMTTAELDAAITRPAERVGVAVEPGLTAAVVADVTDNPGALPLLQYALTEAFDQRETNVLTQNDYRRVGGLRTALTQRAELVYDALEAGQLEICRQLFLRLVTPGEGTGDTRRRLPVEGLADLQRDVEVVLDAFGEARLLTFDHDAATGEATVEVAHEAILTEWDQLRTWVTEAREELTARRRLDDLANEWDRSDRGAEFLLTGGQLDRFEEWLPTSTITISSLDRELVTASRMRRDETHARTRRRRLAIVLALALAAISTSALSLIALGANRDATRNLAVLEATELAKAVVEVLDSDPELAALLSQEALVRAYDAGADLESAVIALQLALQGLHAAFPEEAGPAVVSGPDRASGVFIIPIGDLLDLADRNVDRALTPAECEDHLGAPCPSGPVSGRLPDSVLADPVLVRENRFKPLSGTFVTVGYFDSIPAETAWSVGLSLIRSGLGFFVREDPRPQWPTATGDSRGTGACCAPRLRVFRGVDVGVFAAGTWSSINSDDFRTDTDVGFNFVPINEVVPQDVVSRTLPAALVEQATIDGELSAVWVQYRPTTTLWYREDVLGRLGFDPPQAWDELMTLTEAIADTGMAPWCFGLGGPQGFDYVGNLIESQVLAIGGVELHDAWVSHSVPMTDPRIVAAHERVGALLFNERYHEGWTVINRTNSNAPESFVALEPDCVLWAVPPPVVQLFADEVPDLGVLILGAESEVGVGGVIVDGTQATLWIDAPESRSFLRTVLSLNFGNSVAEAQEGFDLVANVQIDPDTYSNPQSQRLAAELRDGARDDVLRAAFLVEHPDLADTYLTGLSRWLDGGPDVLKVVLADIEAEWVRIDTR